MTFYETEEAKRLNMNPKGCSYGSAIALQLGQRVMMSQEGVVFMGHESPG